jgi:acetyl-CoA carboxylase beta subunit
MEDFIIQSYYSELAVVNFRLSNCKLNVKCSCCSATNYDSDLTTNVNPSCEECKTRKPVIDARAKIILARDAEVRQYTEGYY